MFYREDLLEIWHTINEKVHSEGFERYDYGDILSHPLYINLLYRPFGRYIGYFLRVPDILFPIAWRRILGIKKTVFPTAFYHLGMSYLQMEAINTKYDSFFAKEMCRLAYDLKVDAEHLCWGSVYKHHGLQWSDRNVSKVPPSCAHFGTRLGTLFLRVGKKHNDSDIIKNGINAAKGLMIYHNINYYEDGSSTISYYPYTNDEVINTSADMAVLLAEIPLDLRTTEMQKHLLGLTKMIVNEQQNEGQWYYCTKRHYEKLGGEGIIDNHHTAMNLAALAVIWHIGDLSDEIRKDIHKSLIKGLDYYINHLFNEDGTGFYFPGKRRETEVVGYSEGINAIFEIFHRRVPLPDYLNIKLKNILPKMLQKAIDKFLIEKTGDVASMKRFGLKYNIQSIRWGSGPLLQAITSCLLAVSEEK
ncbi:MULTISPECIES: hypothetical protein [unclassified Paenibacillus]|uniref:hypothetical protein n=1 Tax=unclassified Paenibacillus TaxID=185978 RepID=UPI00363E9D08